MFVTWALLILCRSMVSVPAIGLYLLFRLTLDLLQAISERNGGKQQLGGPHIRGNAATSPAIELKAMLAASRMFSTNQSMLTLRQLRRAMYTGDAEAQSWLVHKMAMGACGSVRVIVTVHVLDFLLWCLYDCLCLCTSTLRSQMYVGACACVWCVPMLV
jgi:hypothetical protein